MITISKVELENGEYYLELRDKKRKLYGIFDKHGRRKHRDMNRWEYEPLPSSREDEWIQKHSFTYEEAIIELQKFV